MRILPARAGLRYPSTAIAPVRIRLRRWTRGGKAVTICGGELADAGLGDRWPVLPRAVARRGGRCRRAAGGGPEIPAVVGFRRHGRGHRRARRRERPRPRRALASVAGAAADP